MLRVQVLEIVISDLGLSVQGLRLTVLGFGCRVGVGSRVYKIWGSGFRVWGLSYIFKGFGFIV